MLRRREFDCPVRWRPHREFTVASAQIAGAGGFLHFWHRGEGLHNPGSSGAPGAPIAPDSSSARGDSPASPRAVAGGAAVTAVQWQRMHGRVLAALPRIYRAEHAVKKLAEMLDAKLRSE